jgi:hypothetical protein
MGLVIASRLHLQSTHAIMPTMNAKHRKTLAAIFSDPANGNMEWNKIEALFTAIDCRSVEGAGSSVTFERNGIRACFHRPHPARAALRYRIKAAREFLTKLGEIP